MEQFQPLSPSSEFGNWVSDVRTAHEEGEAMNMQAPMFQGTRRRVGRTVGSAVEGGRTKKGRR